MKNKSQTGSIHLIIIIIIVLVVLGGLGFVAWNSFFRKDATKKTSDTSKTTSKVSITNPDLNYEVSDTLVGTNLAINYPSGWTKVDDIKTPDGTYIYENTLESYYLYNSTETGIVTIRFNDSSMGTGISVNACSAEDEFVVLDTADMPNFPTLGFIASAYVFPDSMEENQYIPLISIYKKPSGNETLDCTYYKNNMIIFPIEGDENKNFSLDITPSQWGSFSTSTSLDNIKDFVDTDGYSIAKQIVQSLHFKDQ